MTHSSVTKAHDVARNQNACMHTFSLPFPPTIGTAGECRSPPTGNRKRRRYYHNISTMKSFSAVSVLVVAIIVLSSVFLSTDAFSPSVVNFKTNYQSPSVMFARQARKISENEVYNKKISDKRRRELGIADDEDEYDLDIALDNSTDPFITKVIAGSLILSISALLVAGIIIPATTDYGEGVCNALLTGGRC